jgi:hypothetical protein
MVIRPQKQSLLRIFGVNGFGLGRKSLSIKSGISLAEIRKGCRFLRLGSRADPRGIMMIWEMELW